MKTLNWNADTSLPWLGVARRYTRWSGTRMTGSSSSTHHKRSLKYSTSPPRACCWPIHRSTRVPAFSVCDWETSIWTRRACSGVKCPRMHPILLRSRIVNTWKFMVRKVTFHFNFNPFFLAVLPGKSPRISGSKSNFILKGRIDLNCTSPKSKPGLSWILPWKYWIHWILCSSNHFAMVHQWEEREFVLTAFCLFQRKTNLTYLCLGSEWVRYLLSHCQPFGWFTNKGGPIEIYW